MQGVSFNQDSTKYDNNGNMAAIYFKDEIGGFAVHLLQKK
jgi:2-dehydro-3-deoxyphosphogluconate aldolase / (4S)-4-hydroxy-2-oxoglutarate aldolase